MEDIVGIILLLCLAAAGYLLYCGTKALLLCIVPVLCGLALGYYCLIGIRSVLFRAVGVSPLAYVRPRLSGHTLSFDFSRPALHGLNQLAGVLAGVFTGLLVFVVEAYTQAFESAFEGSPTLKYVGMAVAWALPLCVWAWVRSGGGTNRWYENIVESSLKRRGLLGSRLMSALKELDGIESAIEQVSGEIGIAWETRYRDAVEEYIESHPEVVADSRPAEAMVRMTRQLAGNDLNGLRGCSAVYQEAMRVFKDTSDLLGLSGSAFVLRNLEEYDAILMRSKTLLLKRDWEEFNGVAEVVVGRMENLARAVQNEGPIPGDSAERDSGGGAPQQSPYETLGIQPGSTREELEKALNEKRIYWHSDKYQQLNIPAEMKDFAESEWDKVLDAYTKIHKILKANGC
jgi:hypothetical protein